MRNWKIGAKLTAALGVLVALLVGVAALALVELYWLNASTRQITHTNMASVELINRLNTDLVKARLLEVRHVYNDGADYKLATEREMQALQKEMDDIKTHYSALITHPEERSAYETLLSQRKTYVQLMAQLFALSRSGDTAAARAFLGGQSLQLFNTSAVTLKQLLDMNTAYAQAAVAKAAASYRIAVWAMAGATAVALAIAIIAGIWLTRSIRDPLQSAVRIADRVAGGDLSSRIEVRSRDEVGQLFDAMRRMQESLTDTVQVVRRSAEGVAAASNQIALGNADLSARTERQASSLEETAASMEQLGSTVRLNADNAREAHQLANVAANVAVQGGEVVGDVVTTMHGINTSSRKIADIITVIDSIAFQTNILALNAAVEAARAGEQGRGFAVVASEVRALAGRSADAAKEIKTLITESVGRVEQGSALVDRAGTTMAEVVSAIQKVTAIVAEISNASGEQSQGLSQVGEAVMQIDQATQQNAALVEESAAASDSLRRQAQELVEAVEVFHLGDSKSASTARQRSASAAPLPASVGSRGHGLPAASRGGADIQDVQALEVA